VRADPREADENRGHEEENVADRDAGVCKYSARRGNSEPLNPSAPGTAGRGSGAREPSGWRGGPATSAAPRP
jgi:hypothetical protein